MDITTAPAEEVWGTAQPDEAGTMFGDLTAVVVVQVSGEIDLYTGPALRSTLAQLLPPPSPLPPVGHEDQHQSADVPVRAVVVDLTEVSFIDSFALGVLICGHRLAHSGGRAYAVIATNAHIRGLFARAGLLRVIPLHADLSSALGSLPASLSTSGAVSGART